MKKLLLLIPMLMSLSCATRMSDEEFTKLLNVGASKTNSVSESTPPTDRRVRQFCWSHFKKSDTSLYVFYAIFNEKSEVTFFYYAMGNITNGSKPALRLSVREGDERRLLLTSKEGSTPTWAVGGDVEGKRFEIIIKGKKQRPQNLRFADPSMSKTAGTCCFEITNGIDIPKSAAEIEADPYAFLMKQYERNKKTR